jgi:outer membrane protein
MKPIASTRALIAAILLSSAPAVLADKADKTDKPADKKAGKQVPVNPLQQPPIDLSQPLTLDRAIRTALERQDTLGIAKSQLQSAQAGITRAQASYYPQVTPGYTYSTQLTSQKFNGVRQTGVVETSLAEIGANLLLYDMGKREQNVALSKANTTAQKFNVLDTRQAIIENVSVAYYELKRRKELVRVSDASVERAETTLKSVQASVEAGASPRKDIFQAQADYENAKVQQIQANNDVRIAQTQLKNAMGVLSPLPVQVEEEPLPVPSQTPDTRTAAEYINQAIGTRPDLKRESANITANQHNAKIADINAGFQVGASVNEGFRVYPDAGENRTFETSFTYPLFDAGASRAAARQAKASVEQAKLSLDLAKQQIQLTVEQAYFTREEARASISATQAAVLAARTNYEAARKAREEGAVTGTLLDVITAQAQLVTAETNAVQTIYNFYTSDAQLKRAIGVNDTYPGGT